MMCRQMYSSSLVTEAVAVPRLTRDMVRTCHLWVYTQVLAAAETQRHDGWGSGAQVLVTVVYQLLQGQQQQHCRSACKCAGHNTGSANQPQDVNPAEPLSKISTCVVRDCMDVHGVGLQIQPHLQLCQHLLHLRHCPSAVDQLAYLRVKKYTTSSVLTGISFTGPVGWLSNNTPQDQPLAQPSMLAASCYVP